MRALIVFCVFLAAAACADRHAVSVDGGSDSRGDAAQPQPDGGPPRLDMGGSFVFLGKVLLGEATDPRTNMPGWISARVGFATVFYEAAFGAALTAGDCRFGQMMPPPPAVTNYLEAGAVRVTGGLQPLNFKYSPDSYYADDIKDGTYSLFKGGETLSVTGTGAQLPAFSGALPAPERLAIKTPDLYEMATLIDTSKGYAVTWTPSAADRVRVVIRCDGPEGEYRVECDSHDDGHLTLQSKVLKALAPKCTASKMAQADFIRLNERLVDQGEMRVIMQASTLIRGGLVFN